MGNKNSKIEARESDSALQYYDSRSPKEQQALNGLVRVHLEKRVRTDSIIAVISREQLAQFLPKILKENDLAKDERKKNRAENDRKKITSYIAEHPIVSLSYRPEDWEKGGLMESAGKYLNEEQRKAILEYVAAKQEVKRHTQYGIHDSEYPAAQKRLSEAVSKAFSSVGIHHRGQIGRVIDRIQKYH